MERRQPRYRAIYFNPELDRHQGCTDESLEELFGQLKNHKNEICSMSIGLIISLLIYVLDVVSDVLLAVGYALNEEYLKFGATIAVVYFSSLVTTYVTVVWYRMIEKQNNIRIQEHDPLDSQLKLPKAPKSTHSYILTNSHPILRVLYIFILFILQLAPVVSTVIALKILWQHLRSNREHVERIANELEESNSPNDPEVVAEEQELQDDLHDELKIMGMIKLHADYEKVLQVFLEAVPQTVLQTSLLITDVIAAKGTFFSEFTSWFRVVTILLSVNNVRSSTKAYTSAVTTFTFLIRGRPIRDPIGGLNGFLRALWHLLVPVGRAATLCYVAARFSYAASITSVMIYWAAMLLWLQNDFQGWKRLENFVMHAARAWIYIWVAASTKKPRPCDFYGIYYFIILVDSIAVCTISGIFAARDLQHIALTIAASVGLCLQLLGAAVKFIYYLRIKSNVPKEANVDNTNAYS